MEAENVFSGVLTLSQTSLVRSSPELSRAKSPPFFEEEEENDQTFSSSSSKSFFVFPPSPNFSSLFHTQTVRPTGKEEVCVCVCKAGVIYSPGIEKRTNHLSDL